MGGIRKPRKIYDVPRKRWDKTRIEEEKKVKETYGLKNKKELRVFQTFVRKKRQNAKSILVLPLEQRVKKEKELVASLSKYGVLPDNASVDDVLSLQTQELLEKRLQTIVWRKNLAKTAKQARQFIVHGHIAIGEQKITAPSHMVLLENMDKIGYFGGKKMQLEPPKPESKQEMKKRFEAAALEQAEKEEQSQVKEKEEVSENE